jgi:sulfonate transport system substrate-binding protein
MTNVVSGNGILKTGLWFASLLVTFLLVSCSEKQPPLKPVSLRLALAMQPGSSLVMVAQERGYFIDNGLELKVDEFPSGKRALHDSFFRGDSDIALSSDVPVVMAALGQKDFLILASTFSANNLNSIIARKDAGIETAADLKGKTIGTQKASAVHFFLNLFLVEHTIANEMIESVFFKAEQFPDKLAEGAVDAFSMREPYISQAQQKLGDNYIVFEQPGLYQQRDIVISNSRFVRDNPLAVERFMKSLLQAERFVLDHPAEAIGIISERLGVTRQSLESKWSQVSMRVVIDQPMLLVLEDISRWAILENLTDATTVPNFLDFLDPKPLESVSKTSVTLIQ